MPKAFYRPILGRSKRADFDLIIQHVRDGLDSETKPKIIRWFEDYISNWKKDISFASRKNITKDGITIYVWPTGPDLDVWKYVSFGTRTHSITPKRAKVLAFNWAGPGGNKPLTFPYQGPPRLSSGATPFRVVFKKVDHPGIEPRHIEKQIAENPEHVKEFRADIEKFFRRGIRAAKRNIESRRQ